MSRFSIGVSLLRIDARCTSTADRALANQRWTMDYLAVNSLAEMQWALPRPDQPRPSSERERGCSPARSRGDLPPRRRDVDSPGARHPRRRRLQRNPGRGGGRCHRLGRNCQPVPRRLEELVQLPDSPSALGADPPGATIRREREARHLPPSRQHAQGLVSLRLPTPECP